MFYPRFVRFGLFPIFLAVALASSLWSSSLFGQSAPKSPATNPPSPFHLQLQSNLVIVRVVVRDARGEPIKGLKREDFKLFDQGKEQIISQFEEVTPDQAAPDSAIGAPGQAAVPSGPRFVALYFDDLNSTDADLMQARDAADRYLARSLQPNDHVAIFVAEKVLADFTSDPTKIHQALMQLHTKSGGPASEHICPDLSDYQALQLVEDNDPESDAWKTALAEAAACPVKAFTASGGPNANALMVSIRMLAQRIVDRSQDLTRANMQQFEQVVKFMAEAPGSRSVVLVSPGFLSQFAQRSLDRIINRALRAGVVINSLDPKGLAVLLRESDASRMTVNLEDPRAAQARANLDKSREFAGADVLAELAEGTGGEFFHNDNDLRAGFRALVGDSPHYILAFAPKNVKADGKFHAIKASLAQKRKGSRIQARRGYFATADAAAIEQAAEPTIGLDVASEGSKPTAGAAGSEKASSSGAATVAANSQPFSTPVAKAPERSVEPATTYGDARPLHLHKGVSNKITAGQLRQLVAEIRGKSDAETANQLTAIELTERIDAASLAHLEADLPGIQSRDALLVVADQSAFLKPPASVAPLPPTPSVEEQVQWLKAAANYAVNALGKLPDFFATRDVTVFGDSPARVVGNTFFAYQPLHSIDQSKVTVVFRDGKETFDSGEAKIRNSNSATMGLVTSGEFGPLLGLVLADASRSSLSWSHWESGATGPVSVYRYAVPPNKSHYRVEFCCASGDFEIGNFRQIAGYHGEITVDPSDGKIVRITLLADLHSAFPMIRADMMVEYGSVEIGGKTYICPVRSVSIAKAYTKAPSHSFEGLELGNRNDLPQQTLINNIEFEQYHVFRTDLRVLPADSQSPQ